MRLPTDQQLASAAAAFDRDWGGVDEVLYGICREHPVHASRREVTAKIALVDRAYSAGLERRVTPPPGKQAFTGITDCVLSHAAEIDGIIARVTTLREPLVPADMTEIVRGHGELTALLQKVATDGKARRYFAAKYLHFHSPVVPIYDSYAAAGLVRLVPWKMVEEPFAQPDGADTEYWSFCVRLLWLYEACRQAVPSVSVKNLDAYLWAVPGAK